MLEITKTAHELLGQFLGSTEDTEHIYSDGYKVMACNGKALAYFYSDQLSAGFYDLAVIGKKSYTFTEAMSTGMFPGVEQFFGPGKKIEKIHISFKEDHPLYDEVFNLKLKLGEVGIAISDQVIDAVADSFLDFDVYYSAGKPVCFTATDDNITINVLPDTAATETVKTIQKLMKKSKPVANFKVPEGTAHRLTSQIAAVAELGIYQMLVGPAGSGKTTTGEKVAEMLKIPFFPMSVGPQTTKSDLLGFIDANGNYHTTPLRNAFENGGLLLLDEVDSANAGVLTIINSLLANGYCSFPDAVIKRHEKFRCICSANTFGRGADRQYVGRNQLDAATLDRFVVVDFEYDEDLERLLSGNDDWTERVQKYRRRAFDLKERIVISPRASINGAKLIAAGLPEETVEQLTIWKGISPDIIRKIKSED